LQRLEGGIAICQECLSQPQPGRNVHDDPLFN
jgi:hypothetical protein